MNEEERHLAFIRELIDFYSQQVVHSEMLMTTAGNKDVFEMQISMLKNFVKTLEAIEKDFFSLRRRNVKSDFLFLDE